MMADTKTETKTDTKAEAKAEKENLDARIAAKLEAGATTFTEDEAAAIADKFGVKNEDHPFGNAHTEEDSPTKGTVAAGAPHPSVDEAVTPESLEKDKKK